MSTRRLLAIVFAAAFVGAGCVGAAEEEPALPPPPPVDDTINTTAEFNDDLAHLILTPVAGDPGSAEGSSAEPSEEPGSLDPSRYLTEEMAAQVPAGAPLVVRDGQLGYLDGEEFVPFDDTIEPSDEVAGRGESANEDVDEQPSYGNPYVDQLAQDPAVESIVVIGDGTYGVAVSDPSVIDPNVFGVAEDVPFGLTADPYESYQWGLENDGTSLQGVRPIEQVADADMDVLPTIGHADGDGIVVAVVDSGVDFSHPDLAGSSWVNADEECGNGIDDDANGYVDDCTGWDFGNNDAQSYEPGNNPHGTHVAGIIAASRNGAGVAGIAPGATIMDLNVGTRSGGGESISGASITAAIRYAVDNGADVINLSLGTEPGATEQSVAGMGAAIDYAGANGVVVVTAAGNHGIDLGASPVYPASFNKPNMLVAGASSPSDTRASFSNFNADVVDFYAPGELILSTMPGGDYQFMSGTSQASPAVAATVALVMDALPDASWSAVMDAVMGGIEQRVALSTSSTSGRVNAANSVGVNGDDEPAELAVAVRGLRDPSNELATTIEISAPSDAFVEAHQWELSLIYRNDAGAHAVINHPVAIDGVATTTADDGTLLLVGDDRTGSGGVHQVTLATDLPGGGYSFVVEAVPTADRSFRLGDAFVTSFEVPGEPGEEPAITTVPTTDRTESTATTGGATGDPGSADGTDGVPSTTTGGSSGSSPSPTSPTDAPGSTAPAGGGSGGSGSGGGGSSEGGPSTTAAGTASTTTTPTGGPTTTSRSTSTGGSNGAGGSTGSSTTVSSGSDSGGGSAGGGTTGGGGTNTGDGGTTTPSTTPLPDIPPAPAGLGSGVASKGAWRSTSVSPQTGYVGSTTVVVIEGNFPSDTYVWFGEQPGQVVSQDRQAISVRTPLRSEAGIVDITLRQSARGIVLRIPDAYAFVAGDSLPGSSNGGGDTSGGGSDSGTGGGTGSGGSTGTDSGTGTDTGIDTGRGDEGTGGGTDPGTGGGGGTGGDDGGAGNDGDDRVSDRRGRMVAGEPLELANGLTARPLSPDLTSGVRSCSSDPCPAAHR